MILNIKIPFNYIQVNVYTKSISKLDPIEFLLMNLINSKDNGEIQKDKSIKDCLKYYYNIDDKFFPFFYSVFEKLINNDSIIKKSESDLGDDNLFIGDFKLNESLAKHFNNKKYLSFDEYKKNTYSCHNYFSICLNETIIENDNLLSPLENTEKLDFNIIANEKFSANENDSNENKACANSKKYINDKKLGANENISKSEITINEYCLISLNINISIDQNLNCTPKDKNSMIILSTICENNEKSFIKDNFIEAFENNICNLKINQIKDISICETIECDKENIDNLIKNNKLINQIFGDKGFTFVNNKICIFGFINKNIKIQIGDKSCLIENVPFVCFSKNIDNNENIKNDFLEYFSNSIINKMFNWELFIDNKDKFNFLENDLKKHLLNFVKNNKFEYFNENKYIFEYLNLIQDDNFIKEFYNNITFKDLYLKFNIEKNYNSNFLNKIFEFDKNQRKFLNDIKEFSLYNLKFEEFILRNYNYKFHIDGKSFNRFKLWNLFDNIDKELTNLENKMNNFNLKKDISFDNDQELDNINYLKKDLENKIIDNQENRKLIIEFTNFKDRFQKMKDLWIKIENNLSEYSIELAVKIGKDIERFLKENSNYDSKKSNFNDALKSMELSKENKNLILELKKFRNMTVHDNENKSDYQKDWKYIKDIEHKYEKFKDLLNK